MAAAGRSASRVAAPLVVAAAVAVTYANTLRNGFVWDDHQIVVENVLNRSLANAWTVLTSSDVLTKTQPTGYYRPLSRLAYVIEYQVFGLDPLGYHLVNVAAHCAVALLVLALARRLFGSEPPAMIAALLVAVHPVHGEPVNLVSARNNILAAACTLLAFLAYLRARDAGGRALYAVAGGAYLAGLLFKETALMLLPFLVIFEASSGRGWRRALREQAPVLCSFAALAAAYLGLRAAVLGSFVGQRVRAADVPAAAWNVLHSVPKYLTVVLWPDRLTLAYRDPPEYFTSPLALALAWTLIALAVIALLRQNRPVSRVGSIWAAVNFLPVSTLIPFASAPMAERYLYLPVIGLWLVLADQAALLVATVPALRRPLGAALAVALVALAGRGIRRNVDWRDDRAIFGAAVRSDPDSAFAQYNLGVALRETGESDGARRAWERAIAAEPTHAGALAELGRYHAERGELADAERYLEQVLQLDPRDSEAHFNLALVMEKTARPREALDHYARFLATAPEEHGALRSRVRDRMRALESSIGSPRP